MVSSMLTSYPLYPQSVCQSFRLFSPLPHMILLTPLLSHSLVMSWKLLPYPSIILLPTLLTSSLVGANIFQRLTPTLAATSPFLQIVNLVMSTIPVTRRFIFLVFTSHLILTLNFIVPPNTLYCLLQNQRTIRRCEILI